MASHADADLILKLYDLRREDVIRAARKAWMAFEPQDAETARRAGTDLTLELNAHIRQVTSYWEMAFSIANQGAIDPELFARNCGEGLLSVLKCQLLAAKFPGVWTRKMPEGEQFLAGNATAQAKAEMIRQRYFASK